jgi:hypothetical protein
MTNHTDGLDAAGVAVKALIWRDGDAKTGFGSAYTTQEQGDGLFAAIGCGSFVGTTYPTRDAAKAAAQSDYERRIRSALVDAPAGEMGGALREAKTLLADLALGRSIQNDRFLDNKIEGPLWDKISGVVKRAEAALASPTPSVAAQHDTAADDRVAALLPPGTEGAARRFYDVDEVESEVRRRRLERAAVGTRTNIAAFTATKYEGYYPPYISINEVDGLVEITIRSPEKDGAEGSHGVITLSKEEFAALLPPDTEGEAQPVAWQNISAPYSILTPEQYGMRLPLCEGKFRPLFTTIPRPAVSEAMLRQIVFDALDLSEELRAECTDAVTSALTAALSSVPGKESVRRMERWQVPAHELSNSELDEEYASAAEKFSNRSDGGGSPGEFWAERMDEIDIERRRRSPKPSDPSSPEDGR